MKIKKMLERYGYPAVMGVCLVCSAALLFSVTTDRPLVPIAQPHMPVLRVTQTENDAVALPEEMPAETVLQTDETEEPADAVKQEGLQVVLSETGSGYLLTEDFLEKKLTQALPAGFPAEDVDVSFDRGLLTLSFDISRSALKAYFKDQGIDLGAKRNLLLQMLPRQVEMEAAFAVRADESGLHLSPVHVEAGEKTIPLTGLPQDVFSAVDEALNGLLSQAGVHFSSVEFAKDGLLLK